MSREGRGFFLALLGIAIGITAVVGVSHYKKYVEEEKPSIQAPDGDQSGDQSGDQQPTLTYRTIEYGNLSTTRSTPGVWYTYRSDYSSVAANSIQSKARECNETGDITFEIVDGFNNDYLLRIAPGTEHGIKISATMTSTADTLRYYLGYNDLDGQGHTEDGSPFTLEGTASIEWSVEANMVAFLQVHPTAAMTLTLTNVVITN